MRIGKRICLFILIIAFAACSNNFKKTIGISGSREHDEFNVINNPPLSVPPIYELNPPAIYHSNQQPAFVTAKNIVSNKAPSYGERLFLEKISVDDEDIKAIINKKNSSEPKKSIFNKIFSKKRNYSKDSTQDPKADEMDRTYKSKSLRHIETGNMGSKKICNIHNGEVIYCDKNTIMKSFSFPQK